MKLTKSKLKQVIKASLIKEGMFSKLQTKMGLGPEVKKRKEEAYKKLRVAGLKYINDYQNAAVGPFLKKGGGGETGPVGPDARREWMVDYTWKKELHTKKYPEDVKKSIIDQATVLRNILNTYTKESKVKWDDNPHVPLDVGTMAEASSMPGLYKTMETQQEGLKLTKSQLKQIIKEELSLLLKEKIEIGDIVKHEELGQGMVAALRSGKGGDRRVVVKWDRKGEARETIVDSLTIIKKRKKK
jgi:hypothetical protein